jgi:two-component system LytT family response regulator
MLHCIAIDDEPLALDLLEDNIRSIPFLSLKARCRNAMDAMEVMQREHIDLVFSDIQMPGLTGLQLIQSLTVKPMFILITAHEKFALASYDLDVVDYLLKPVAYERFVKACNRALDYSNLLQANQHTRQDTKEFIFVPVDYEMVKVTLADVLMIEGVKDYVRIYYQTPIRTLLVRISMKAILEMLPATSFIRIHKSFIVNVRKITTIRKNDLFVGDRELPIGEQYKDQVTRLTDLGY